MKKYAALILTSLLVGSLSGCHGKTQPANKAQQIVTVKKQANITHLYYDSTIEPLKTVSVITQVAGTVRSLNFKYGQMVHKGQLLMVLSSQKLATDYRNAVNSYLEKKNAYETSYQSFQGDQALHKAGVISKESFDQEQNTYETSILSFYQAKEALEKVLKLAHIDASTIEGLHLNDTKQVNKILQRNFNDLKVYATGTGVALFPPANTSGSSNKELEVGSMVKQGQLLLSIGDMSGLSTTVKVSEININRVKAGQKAVLTGVAFPGVNLNGYVSAVASQAQNSQSGFSSLGMFQVAVVVPKITAAQRKKIHVGMSAKVDIEIKNSPRIMLPIGAVFEQKGKSMVKLKQGDKTVAVPVLTGETTETSVTILQGLKSGDQVVIPAAN